MRSQVVGSWWCIFLSLSISDVRWSINFGQS